MVDPLRERITAAAIALTTELGWSQVTMARVAAGIGVSRQTVYNEVGTKPALADAMVTHELERFLAAVDAAFEAHPGDLVAAVREAVRAVLDLAAHNPLLQAIASVSHGGSLDLLPLLTTRSDTLLQTATAVLRGRVAAFDPPLGPAELDAVIDLITRVVLSHVVRPTGTPAETADRLAWVVGRVLGP